MVMSAETILKASVSTLNLIDVPRKDMYPENIQTSSQNPLKHGLTVILTIFKLVVETKPLAAFGIPSFIFFLCSIVSSIFVINFYTAMGRLPLGMSVFTLLFISITFFLLLAAMLLYALSSISSSINFPSNLYCIILF